MLLIYDASLSYLDHYRQRNIYTRAMETLLLQLFCYWMAPKVERFSFNGGTV